MELLTLNATNSLGPPSPQWSVNGVNQDVMNTTLKDCTHILCRITIRERNIYIPPDLFNQFFEVRKIIRKK